MFSLILYSFSVMAIRVGGRVPFLPMWTFHEFVCWCGFCVKPMCVVYVYQCSLWLRVLWSFEVVNFMFAILGWCTFHVGDSCWYVLYFTFVYICRCSVYIFSIQHDVCTSITVCMACLCLVCIVFMYTHILLQCVSFRKAYNAYRFVHTKTRIVCLWMGRVLDLNNNQLDGVIPASLGSLTKLRYVLIMYTLCRVANSHSMLTVLIPAHG